MRSVRMTTLIAVALPVLLSGCVTSLPSVDRDVCPWPTPRAKLEVISDYLDRAPADKGLDTLATEWERLDNGATICRSK